MPSRSSADTWIAGAAALAASAVLTLLLFTPTLDYGFDYDDYHFMRPLQRSDVAAAFRAHWDPAGIMVPFYRPLTVAFHAWRFDRFGFNSRAHHAVSLLMFASAAAMTGLLAFGLTRRRAAAALAAALFAAHPSMPYAAVAWITNQMHLLEMLVVLAALLWWNAVCRRGFAWWIPLLLFATASFLIKEDGIMLLPVVLAAHWIRRHVADPSLPPAPRLFLACTVALLPSLVAWRAEVLGGLGGYGRPTAARAWANYLAGLNGVFRLVPAHRPWQLTASVFVTVLPVAAAIAWRRATPRARGLMLAGAAAAILFNLPFVFVVKGEQMHLVAAGAVLFLTGAALCVIDAVRGRRTATYAAVLVLLAGVAALGAVARDISTDFRPYGPMVLYHDDIVRGWAAVPQEVRDYLASKRQAAAAERPPPNPVDVLRAVSFGLYPREIAAGGLAYRWMAGPRADIYVAESAREVLIPVRHDAAAFREPATARFDVDGRPADAIRLETTEWRMSRIPLRPHGARRFARMHHIVLSIDRAWVPEKIMPGSRDGRTLGLQIGEIVVR